MNLTLLKVYLLCAGMLLGSCENLKVDYQNKKNKQQSTPQTKAANQLRPVDAWVEYSVNDTLADKLKRYIANTYLKAECLQNIAPKDRRFQLCEIDLNEDGRKEIFINFMTRNLFETDRYPLILIDAEFNLITQFTVTDTPVFVEKTIENGWKILTVSCDGEWKDLIFSNGTYPSNPSFVGPSAYDAPSVLSEIIFDNKYSQIKTYPF